MSSAVLLFIPRFLRPGGGLPIPALLLPSLLEERGIMGSVTKRIRRNMIEAKYGIRTSMSRLKKIQWERETRAKKRADERSSWDKVREMGK